VVLLALDIGWVIVAVFLGVLGILGFAVARGIWHIARGTVESDAGGSWGRQIFGRRKRKQPEDVS
jgi:hypothetical protein